MSKKIKVYSPLMLDIEKEEPTYENDKSKWWLVHISKSKKHSIYRVCSKETKEQDYVLMNNKTNDIETISKQLEQCFVEIDLLEAYERLSK